MVKRQIIFFIALLWLISCRRGPDCPKENLYSMLIGYSAAESDTLLLIRYKVGTNFSSRIDTVLMTAGNSSFNRYNDTLSIMNLNDSRITDEYDYSLVNPFDGKETKISDIKFKPQKRIVGPLSWDPEDCLSPLLS